MLRRTLLASAGVMALTGAAFAADIPSRAPPPVYVPPPPIFTWTGLYIGINAGGTWSSNTHVRTVSREVFGNPTLGGGPVFVVADAALANVSVPFNRSGFIGGGQIGYNYQFANNFVVGFEADIQGIAGSNRTITRTSQAQIVGFPTNPIDQTFTAHGSQNWLGTVRGRLGFTIMPTLLVYGTGGLAYGQGQANINITHFIENAPALPFPFSSSGSISNTRAGWTAGGGGEWLFAPNWSLKVEYLYYNLGSVNFGLSPLRSFNFAGVPFTVVTPRTTASFRGNIVRAGLNYHFYTAPPPIVAKY
jgi:outer membrane immunogenic protein